MSPVTYTHKGWYFLCPVYLNADEGEGMHVQARYAWLDWWFDFNDALFEAFCTAAGVDSAYPFRVTGRLEKPVVLE